MTEIKIDTDTLKDLIRGAVVEAMQPYAKELADVREKTAVLEATSKREAGLCPQNCPCQKRLDDDMVEITKVAASAKSAHHRIDGVFKTAAIVGGTVGGVITIIVTIAQLVLQWHNSATKVAGGG